MRVLAECPDPDVIDTQAVRLPAGAPRDPAWWAGQVFSERHLPVAVRALFVLRQGLVPLIGVRPASAMDEVFAVARVEDGEALIVAPDRHLDFWCIVGVHAEDQLLRVTTVVTLHGWRGRLYWAPVGLLHGPVTRAMMRRAVRRAVAHPR